MSDQPTSRPPQPDRLMEVPLPQPFTCEEMLKMCGEQNKAWALIEMLEKSRVDTLAKIDRAIKKEREIIAKHAKRLAEGSELRPTKVIVAYDPTAGTKNYYAEGDTAKTTPLKTLPMEKADYVLELPL